MRNDMQNRVFFTICNYNAQRNGSLTDSMESLQKLKTDNTVILVWDNASTDESCGILKSYLDNGTIDHLVLSGKNMGKAYAMNTLSVFAKTIYGAVESDVLVSMDSDICIHNEKFSEELATLFQQKQKVGFVGFDYYEDPDFKIRSNYHKLVEGTHITHSINADLCGVTYRPLDSFGGYLAGALIAMRFGMFESVNGYSTDLANGNKLALYGGDDSMLESKLWNSFGRKLMFIFDERKQIIHRRDIDDGYRKWKKDCLRSMGRDGYGRCVIPNVGYYDIEK